MIPAYKIWALVIGLLLTPVTARSQDIQQSHIDANLPDTFEAFETILNRDLQSFFSEKLKTRVAVSYSLLRKVPTQSGVSYPKFYAWVEVFESGQIVSAGAVRVAVLDKLRIEVTHFLPREQIRKDPKVVEIVFPHALIEEIRTLAGVP